jgi:hypothetical protein
MLHALAPLALAILTGANPGAPAPAPEGPTDAEVRAAWQALDADTRRELFEWFRSEVIWLDTFQNGLVRFVLEGQPRDAGLWPTLETAPWYDPAVHAPAQPIPRKALPADGKAVTRKRKEFFFRVPERRLRAAFVYDPASRELRRVAEVDDPDRHMENALAGFRPDHDLAEALVEMQLDDGSQQEVARAFAHAYTDRTGGVYTGLTLYDAWASGARMEMPDVDCLGILHELKDDWKSFVAPVPGPKQEPLYQEVADLFAPYHHHRGLRRALARCYLTGYPVLRDGYGPNLDRLHALWETHESTPEKLAEALPEAAGWERFLSGWVEEVDGSPELLAKGQRRRDTLHADGQRVRALLVSVLQRAEVLPAPDEAR